MILPKENILISQQLYRDYEAGFKEIEDKVEAKIRSWIIKYNQKHS